jgi:Fe2+ or Zn2+ uptake regulation protein
MNNVEQRLAWALEICRKAEMRPTVIRETILAFLAARRVPVSLEAITQAGGVQGCCNPTTVYRTLILFMELEVVRQVSLPNKLSYFVLNMPGENSHFLICRDCGQITELPAVESVSSLEREVAATHGYSQLCHELELFGICPKCQTHSTGIISAKVPMRSPLRGNLKSIQVKES